MKPESKANPHELLLLERQLTVRFREDAELNCGEVSSLLRKELLAVRAAIAKAEGREK